MRTEVNHAEYWDVTNTDNKSHGMLHPFHIHGAHFLAVSRSGQTPNPNEIGAYKDTVEVTSQETARLKIIFPKEGLSMCHCRIIEHENADMMANILIIDPTKPEPHYDLIDTETLTKAFTEERRVPESEVLMPGIYTEGCMNHCHDDTNSGASRH